MSPSEPLRRVFLDHREPPLGTVARALVEEGVVVDRGEAGPILDLSGVTVLLPGARAARLLLAELARRRTDPRGRPIAPPRATTPGRWLEGVATVGTLPRAPAAVTRWAWQEAAISTDTEAARAVLGDRPARHEREAWRRIAAWLAKASDESAAAGRRFEDLAAAATEADDAERFAAAAVVQAAYVRTLEELGFCDPALDIAAAVREGRFAAPRPRVVLAGVTELTPVEREALGAVASCAAIVLGPEDEAGAFDEFGVPVAAAWAIHTVDVPEHSLLFNSTPSELACRAIERIDGHADGAFSSGSAEDTVVVVADPALGPRLTRAAARAGVMLRPAVGRPVRSSIPATLLSALAEYVEQGSVGALTGLAMHPAVEAVIRGSGGVSGSASGPGGGYDVGVETLHRLAAEAGGVSRRTAGLFGPRRAGESDPAFRRRRRAAALCREVHGLIREALPSRTRGVPRRRAPVAWPTVLRTLLTRFLPAAVAGAANADPESVEAVTRILDAVDGFAQLPGDRRFTFQRVIGDVLDVVDGRLSPLEHADDRQVDAVGWLESLFDPAQRVVLAGMNDHAVPGPVRGDSLLSERWRKKLGLSYTEQRRARDAFLLHSLVRTRREMVVLACRTDTAGDRAWPSRLLMTGEDDRVVGRLRRFLRPSTVDSTAAPTATPVADNPHGTGGFSTPVFPPEGSRPRLIEELPVTAFRSYLASPYLFYLRFVLGLDAATEPPRELDARVLGTLVHDALDRFAAGGDSAATAEGRVRDALVGELASAAIDLFGASLLPSVRIQIDLLTYRLGLLAPWFARHAADGWRVYRHEWSPASASIDVGGTPFGLRGRIDRIDRNERTGEVAIIDYKTGAATSPERAHLTRGVWKDLQLPLYRHLIKELGELGSDGEPICAYVVLPTRESDEPFRRATWGEAELAVADQVARDIVRSIRRGEFGDVLDTRYAEGAFAAMCGGWLPRSLKRTDDADGGYDA